MHLFPLTLKNVLVIALVSDYEQNVSYKCVSVILPVSQLQMDMLLFAE